MITHPCPSPEGNKIEISQGDCKFDPTFLNLLGCPFCGSEPVWAYVDTKAKTGRFFCNGLDCLINPTTTATEMASAAKKWNTRKGAELPVVSVLAGMEEYRTSEGDVLFRYKSNKVLSKIIEVMKVR